MEYIDWLIEGSDQPMDLGAVFDVETNTDDNQMLELKRIVNRNR